MGDEASGAGGGRPAHGGRLRSVRRARRIRNAVLKIARNPVVAWRTLWPRYGPLARQSPDPHFRRAGRWSFGALPREPIDEVFPGIAAVDVHMARPFDREPLQSMTPAEVIAIGAMIRVLRPTRLLEIGTFEGNTTVNMAANAPAGARVLTLDLPPDWGGEYALAGVPAIHSNAAAGHQIGRQFRDPPHANRITQLWGDSATFDWERFGPFDFVLIDGCHTYEYARSDTRNALRVVQAGGTIVWHDYGMLEDVSRVVDETAGRIAVRAIQGTRLAVGFP